MIDDILKLTENERIDFNNSFKLEVKSSVKDFNVVLDYFFSQKSKQIRPLMGILLANAIGKFNENQKNFLIAVELIHNATLFHDDIIDESDIRRGLPTLNKKFSNKIAVLTGDFFLSLAIKIISKLANNTIYNLLGEYMKLLCEGEIEQNYTLNKIISIEEYIEKSKKKTGLLFELTAVGIAVLSDNKNEAIIEDYKTFGENFGIAFQIKDDINNFKDIDNKPVLNDLKSGVITAPIIYLSEQCQDIQNMLNYKKYDDIIEMLKHSDAISKTNNLMNIYSKKALTALSSVDNNLYKTALIKLLSEF